jgi:Holliday junction resolvasome RuvABC endonuclease subunit
MKNSYSGWVASDIEDLLHEDSEVMLFGGIDPGLYSTTLAILDSNCKLVAYHQIYAFEDEYPRTAKTNRKPGQRYFDPIPEKIAEDHRAFMINMLYTYKLECIATEKMEWSASHSDTQGWVHHNRGIIHGTCLDREVPFYMINPQQIKKIVTGKGNASKIDVVTDVYAEYHHAFKNISFLKKENHIADAIGAAKFIVSEKMNYIDESEFGF